MKRKNLIHIIGTNHKVSPIDVREQLTVKAGCQGEILSDLLERTSSVREGVLISTCNRVELYVAGEVQRPEVEDLFRQYSDRRGIPWEEVSDHYYYYHGEEAIHHLFRVSSSLDSMVVGETQIINQVKQAYRQAKKEGATGKLFNRLFQYSLSVAKKVHDETRIGEEKISISSIAVDYAYNLFEDVTTKTTLQVGAGKTARLCLEHLRSRGVEDILICNRDFNRAEELAENLDAEPWRFNQLNEALWDSDILLVATSSREPIIGVEEVKEALRKRQNEPLFVLDLSVPRNVDEKVGDLDRVYLYNVDDLESIVEQNLESRGNEASRCEEKVEQQKEEFLKELKGMNVGSFIQELQSYFSEIGEEELSRSLNRLNSLQEEEQEEVERMVDRILNKILHAPITSLKQEFEQGNGYQMVQTVRDLFQLEQESSGGKHEEKKERARSRNGSDE